MADYVLDWSELAFASKKPINTLQAIFIAAPREISLQRFRQFLQHYLPTANLIIGIANEPFILGFEDQPHFRTLPYDHLQSTIELVNNKAKSPHKVYVLRYDQKDLVHILQKCKFQKVIFVNGSWQYSFHTRQTYYALASRRIDYELVSPFCDETEAQAYWETIAPSIQAYSRLPIPGSTKLANEMLHAANQAATYSFDYNFQTGVALGKLLDPALQTYMYITATHNRIVPYETYALHHGAAREKHFSPPHDLNHYDTVHAEAMLILAAATEHFDLSDTSMFINLLPCPTCSRLLAATPIKEVVYSVDHSGGYAVRMLEAAGKTVRRLVGDISNEV